MIQKLESYCEICKGEKRTGTEYNFGKPNRIRDFALAKETER